VVPALRFAENSACMARIELAIYLMGDADTAQLVRTNDTEQGEVG